MQSLFKLALTLSIFQILFALVESNTGFGVSADKKDNQWRWLKEKCSPFPVDYNYDYYYEYRIDPKSGECHRLGLKGGCPSNMIFYDDPKYSEHGTCDCSTFEARTLIYHEKSNQCYFVMTQAYCSPGQWLILNRNSLSPVCEVNPCLARGRGRKRQSQSEIEKVLFNGRCVLLKQWAPECKEDEFVDFREDKILPRCTGPHGRGSVGAPSLKTPECTPGRLHSVSGNCVKSWEW